MEHAARRFARWVLIIHLLALVVIGVLVVLAAREVYHSSREQALDQARRRQELLAGQTARGIENYYRSILDNLDLQRRAAEGRVAAPSPTTAPDALRPSASEAEMPAASLIRELLAQMMWSQLRGRASHFFSIDRSTMRYSPPVSEDGTISTKQVIALAGPWLKTLGSPQISDTYQLPGGSRVNLVAVPFRGISQRTLVAVVPLDNVHKSFLTEVNQAKLMSGWLVDDTGEVMISFDPRLVGLNIHTAGPRVREIAGEYLQSAQPGTEIIEKKFQMGPVELSSAMLTIHPISLPGNKWLLAIASTLDDVDAVVQRVFRRAFWWAVFVIVSLMAVFTSSAIFMIRSRFRLERMRREILTRELDQAREIQLAWLPDNRRGKVALDVAAVNQPASHISGDFYNWFELPDGRTVVLIGDVTGHGMSAAFLMATTQLLVRMTITNCGDAGKCLDEVNRQLCAQGFSGQFVTMLLLVVERDGQTVQVATAGHPAPLSTGSSDTNGFVPMPVEPQLVLGVEQDINYEAQTFHLTPGSSLLLYTDGVCDALSASGDRFGTERLAASLAPASAVNAQGVNAQGVIDRVLNAVNQFRSGRPLADDLTLVAIQLTPAAIRTQPVAAAASS